MISLFVNYYRDAVPARHVEIQRALMLNLANRHIDRVVVLCATPPPVVSPKLIIHTSPDRPTFQHYFDAINSYTGAADINIVANSDIYFDDTIGLVTTLSLSNRCLALTRWDVLPDGSARHLNWSNSQDVWVFLGRMRAIRASQFCPGQPACDWRLAALLRRHGYKLFNPSRDIRAYHLHRSGVRRSQPYVFGAHGHVDICDLSDVKP